MYLCVSVSTQSFSGSMCSFTQYSAHALRSVTSTLYYTRLHIMTLPGPHCLMCHWWLHQTQTLKRLHNIKRLHWTQMRTKLPITHNSKINAWWLSYFEFYRRKNKCLNSNGQYSTLVPLDIVPASCSIITHCTLSRRMSHFFSSFSCGETHTRKKTHTSQFNRLFTHCHAIYVTFSVVYVKIKTPLF